MSPIRNESGESAVLASCFPPIPLNPLIKGGFEREKL
jgi:hypothetical protein